MVMRDARCSEVWCCTVNTASTVHRNTTRPKRASVVPSFPPNFCRRQQLHGAHDAAPLSDPFRCAVLLPPPVTRSPRSLMRREAIDARP